jgi:hypothetical protein
MFMVSPKAAKKWADRYRAEGSPGMAGRNSRPPHHSPTWHDQRIKERCMTTPFGPRLIGESEKTLNALLCRFLTGTRLNESQWVTLRLAGMLDGTVDGSGLTDAARDRAQLSDADSIVAELTSRGPLDDGRLTGAGRELVEQIQATVTEATRPVWQGLPEDDVAATTRVLNEVLARARTVLTGL